MRPSHFIPPVAALILAGVCIGTQRRSMSAVEEENALLQKHITAARSLTTDDGTADGQPSGSAKLAKGKETLDWKKIAEQLAEMQRGGGTGDMRWMISLQQRLRELTRDEIVTALDEIAALELTDDARSALEEMLVGQLAEKDPELALMKFIDRYEEDRGIMGWVLTNAMKEWAKKDPANAAAWFDREIAVGQFDSKSLDGKSRARNQFEGTLIQILLDSDPAAAANRLDAMPETQRGEILSHYSFEQLKEENQAVFAKLVRDQVPEKDQAKTLADQASRLVGKGDYAKVTGFLNRIEATAAEKAACVEHAAETRISSLSSDRKITREDIDDLREWAGTQSPSTTDSVTGKALQNACQNDNRMNFGEAAELATHYHHTSGNDDVLCSFLDGWLARQNKDQARVLAARISDEKRREEILRNLK